MRLMNLAVTVAAGMACTAAAMADVDLVLESTQDVALLCDSTNNPTFYIGNNPAAVCLVGDNLFVGGYNNTLTPAPGQVVKIETIFGTRGFRTIPATQGNLNAFRGFYGATYDWGAGHKGLVLSYDSGAVGTAGAFKLFDIDTQLNPILTLASPGGVSPRGGAEPAFDYGFDGQGFDLTGDGVKDGPVLAVLDFSSYGTCADGVARQAKGPLGVRVETLQSGTNRVYDGCMLDGLNLPVSPIVNTVDESGNRIQGTIWRDISIDPRNGTVAVRASNDLVIATRNSNNATATLKVLDLSPGTADNPDPYAFQFMQRCEILWGLDGADGAIVYNDYSAAGTDAATWTKFVNTDGTPAAVHLKNADGSSFVGSPSTGGVFDYSWDPVAKRLAISDFTNRKVYIFGLPQPPACGPCYADYNQDGGVDGSDVAAFFTDWEGSSGCSDTNEDGGIDGGDVETFFSQWSNGGC